MVDHSRVRAKLSALDRYLARLRDLAAMDVDAYIADRAYEGRYLAQAAAQVCIDVANHLIASEGWIPAMDFREAFDRLGEHEVLTPDHVALMQDLTGLRNRLVHLYDDIDDRLVHEALGEGLGDLEDFATAIARLLVDPDGM
ncbi:MAG: type VII toxin-antitoxin system HepT family RNase toxin [Egibacteraceae bacterium]